MDLFLGAFQFGQMTVLAYFNDLDIIFIVIMSSSCSLILASASITSILLLLMLTTHPIIFGKTKRINSFLLCISLFYPFLYFPYLFLQFARLHILKIKRFLAFGAMMIGIFDDPLPQTLFVEDMFAR